MDAKFLRPLIVSLATYSVLSFLCLEYCSLDIPPTSYSETVAYYSNLISEGNASLKKIFVFNWRIIALQHYNGFFSTPTWINYEYTSVPSFLDLPPPTFRISPLWTVTEHRLSSLETFLLEGDQNQKVVEIRPARRLAEYSDITSFLDTGCIFVFSFLMLLNCP